MAIYRIKRFTENQQESHTGRNLLLGAGLTAGALFAGKRGLLGTSAQRVINKGWTRAGKAIGSEGMMQSGSRGVANAEATAAYNKSLEGLSEGALDAAKANKQQFIDSHVNNALNGGGYAAHVNRVGAFGSQAGFIKKQGEQVASNVVNNSAT